MCVCSSVVPPYPLEPRPRRPTRHTGFSCAVAEDEEARGPTGAHRGAGLATDTDREGAREGRQGMTCAGSGCRVCRSARRDGWWFDDSRSAARSAMQEMMALSCLSVRDLSSSPSREKQAGPRNGSLLPHGPVDRTHRYPHRGLLHGRPSTA